MSRRWSITPRRVRGVGLSRRTCRGWGGSRRTCRHRAVGEHLCREASRGQHQRREERRGQDDSDRGVLGERLEAVGDDPVGHQRADRVVEEHVPMLVADRRERPRGRLGPGCAALDDVDDLALAPAADDRPDRAEVALRDREHDLVDRGMGLEGRDGVLQDGARPATSSSCLGTSVPIRRPTPPARITTTLRSDVMRPLYIGSPPGDAAQQTETKLALGSPRIRALSGPMPPACCGDLLTLVWLGRVGRQ